MTTEPIKSHMTNDDWEQLYKNPLYVPQVRYRGWLDIFHSLFRHHSYNHLVSTTLGHWRICSCGLMQPTTN